MNVRQLVIDLVILVGIAGIAVGRLPRLRMNRATIAVAAAALLVAVGGLSFDEALAAIDGGTIVLLFAMMVVVANLRISGFFELAGSKALAIARGPRTLLAVVIAVSGGLSALFVNDTICVMLTPLVAAMTIRARRDPVPYLVAVATAANVGSGATIIGNPQNMLIGSASAIPFGSFFLELAMPSLLGLAVCYLVITLAFRREFASGERIAAAPRDEPVAVDRLLMGKSLAAAGLLLVLLLLGVDTAFAALVAAAILLVTRRISPEKVLAEVDFTLLVFFSGLFALTRAVERTDAFAFLMEAAAPFMKSSLGAFAAASAALSNLVSNVPAVMLLKPFIAGFADRERAWLVLAMSATYAGNLTLLGSVANLIVAEGAKPFGVHVSFGRYLKAGLPITILTVAIGTAWLTLF